MFIVLLFSWTIKPKGLQVKTFQVIENEEEFGSVLEAPFDFIIKKPTFVTLLAKIPETNK